MDCIFSDDMKLRMWNVLGGVGGVVCVVLNECLECWFIMLFNCFFSDFFKCV